MKNFVFFLVVSFLCPSMYSQNVTFSSTGESGLSGTNWSITSNVLLVESGGASINVSVITNHLTNTGNLEVRAISASTNQNISIDSPITYTGASNRILTFRSRNDIQINQSISATTAALNLIFSTADAGDGEATIRANISTNGGHIAIGGQWTLGTQTWNGLTIPTSPAIVTTENKQGIDVLGAVINTNGGNVRMYGKAYMQNATTGNVNYGIELDRMSLQTSSGTIELNGSSDGKYVYGSGIWISAITGSTSISSTSGSISIFGIGNDMSGTDNGFRHGTMLLAKNGFGIEIKSTSGVITLEGSSLSSYAATQDKSGIQLQVDDTVSTLQIVSQTGNINIKGSNLDDGDGQYNNAIRFSASDVTNNIEIGYDGTNAYSGNILIQANSILQSFQNVGSSSLSIKTTGAITIEPKDSSFTQLRAGGASSLTLDDDWDFGTTASSFTFGKLTNTKNFTMSRNLTVNGYISIFGGLLSLNGTITSSNTGDIVLKSNVTNSGGNPSIYLFTDILKTGGSRSKLLIQALGRINFASPKKIEATNSILDVIIWSDYDNSNNDGGTTVHCDILSNGGHVWLGGSNSNAGSMTWNGLVVGDGPSIGTSGLTNYNAMDFSGNIITSGGDIFIWTGDGYTAGGGYSGIDVYVANRNINADTGDITIIANGGIKSNSINLITTGKISIAPNASSFISSPFVFSGTTAANNFTGTGSMSNIVIKNILSVTQLNIGYYVNSNGLSLSNSGTVTISSPYTTNGALYFKGGTINLNGALTATNNKITFAGSGTVTQSQPIVANDLVLLNTGTFTLTNTSNTVNTISGGESAVKLSSLDFINSGAFAVSSSGIYASGTIALASNIGNVTVSYPISTVNTSGNAIKIIAGKTKLAGDGTGGDVSISSSSNILVGTGGTAKIYGGTNSATVLPGTIAANKRYYVDATTASFFPSIGSGNYVLLREAQNKWAGTISSSWNVAGNWSANFVPTSTDDVVIDTNGANAPILNVDFTLGSTNNFKISNTGTLTIAPGKALTITGNADFGDKSVVFKSDITGSGVFGTLSGTLSGASQVTIERYIPAQRSFRFLSSSVTSTTTIRENWQENGVNNNGYGTHITGSGNISNGFDTTQTNNPSMFTFSNNLNAWSSVTNTNINTLIAGVPYRLMIRGNRMTDMSTNTPTPTITTLRAKGTLFTGTKTLSGTELNQNPQGFSFIGNPYQAPLNIKTALSNATNMNPDFAYYWDPSLNLRGGYVTRDLSANSNDVGSLFNEYLQPGQAVFVKKANTSSAASISFSEAHKSTVNAAAGVFRTTQNNATLRAKLLTSIDNQIQEIDGVLVVFNPSFTVDITDEDATKMSNLDEQIAIKYNNKLVSINKIPNPQNNDELVLDLKNYRANNYMLQFETINYNGLQPYLFDSMTNIYTLIQNSDTTSYSFNVQTTTPASVLSNRFKIVFDSNLLSIPQYEISFAIYPNPSSENGFTIDFPSWDYKTKVFMTNALGQNININIMEISNSSKYISIQKELPTGVYYISIVKEGVQTIKKWIKN
jgi:hypothetical protein